MSSKVKTMSKKVKSFYNIKRFECENSLLGSIMLSIGKLKKVKEDEIINDFQIMKRDIESGQVCFSTIKDLCDMVCRKYKVRKGKENLVLFWDEKKVYTPLVTLMQDNVIFPISDDGIYNGILQCVIENPEDGRYELEYIYS